MPQVFKLGSYWVYFWTNEGKPLEPIHVHISQGSPIEHSTKVWITSAGKTFLANNNSHIPERLLKNMNTCLQDNWQHIKKDYFRNHRSITGGDHHVQRNEKKKTGAQ